MASYKKFGKLFEPNGHEHRTLKNVRAGELTEPMTMARLWKDHTKPVDAKLFQTAVADEFQRWKHIHKNNIAYIAIDLAEVDENAYVIQAFLQPMGENALFALERGLVWSNANMKPDLQATVDFYERALSRNMIGPEVWGPVTTLAREYPELRQVRAKLVYERMKGDMDKSGVIRPPVNA